MATEVEYFEYFDIPARESIRGFVDTSGSAAVTLGSRPVASYNLDANSSVASLAGPGTTSIGYVQLPGQAPTGALSPATNGFFLSTLGTAIAGNSNCTIFDAKLLPNGNILYCCGRDSAAGGTNGVAEIDPRTGELVFQWRDPNWQIAGPAPDLTNGPECAWKYPNGNYLIADVDVATSAGTVHNVYELTPAGTKVWNWSTTQGNRIMPAMINGVDCIILFGYGKLTGGEQQQWVHVIRRSDQSVIWSMGGFTGSANGGDFRRIGGVNYLLVTEWQAAGFSVKLVNYDTKTVVRTISTNGAGASTTGTTGTLTAIDGTLDAKFLSDTLAVCADGKTNNTYSIINFISNSIDSRVTHPVTPLTNARTMSVQPLPGTSLVLCCHNTSIYTLKLATTALSKNVLPYVYPVSGMNVAGYSKSLNSANTIHGTVVLGDTAANQGVLDYDGSSGFLNLDNTYNNNSGDIRIRTKTAGTPLIQVNIPGSGIVTLQKGTAVAAGSAQSVGVKVSSTANLGIYFGTGAPSFSAAKGSIYSSTDATTTTTRLYVNTDGGTTWTNLTTAA